MDFAMDILNMDWVKNQAPIPVELLQLITAEQAWEYRVIPLKSDGETLFFFSDSEADIREVLEILTGKNIELIPFETAGLNRLLAANYRLSNQARNETKATVLQTSSGDDFLEKLIGDAEQLGSSDIHVETYENMGRVRIRIDGKLIEKYQVNKDQLPSIINKIKIKANLDIAEKRLPQDGRIYFETGAKTFDIRVSTVPTLYGEKVVLRLLGKDASHIDLFALGFDKTDLDNYLDSIKKPHGIILISGPTGSGKTTTLYATLKQLNNNAHNILTIEDPIEYTLEGINQVQVKEAIGLSFENVLKSFLRQDPDIIMVGEIRNKETAQMAIRAALTGHLVLSTIHTNSAWGTITRLLDMGIPSFMLANTMNASIAQRLVRILCNDCKMVAPLLEKDFPAYSKHLLDTDKQYLPKGCPACHYTGYKGRKAIYEVIPVDDFFALKIKDQVFDIRDDLKQKNILTLAENAYTLFKQHTTSLEEVYPMLAANI
jgi:type IV pilus assembly protein PilB